MSWAPDERYKQPQFKDPSGTLMMLPSDLVLIQDAGFKKYVDVYAKVRRGVLSTSYLAWKPPHETISARPVTLHHYTQDKAAFYKDFAAAFQTLEELGTSNLRSVA